MISYKIKCWVTVTFEEILFCVHINISFYYSMHAELRYFWIYSYTIAREGRSV